MQITEVRVFPVQDDKLRAFVSVVLDGCFMVNDIRVVEGKQGLFISMPGRRRRNGEMKDIAHPLNQETRRYFEERILAEVAGAAEGREPSSVPTAEVAARREEPASEGHAESPSRAPNERSLEEIERAHLSDSFWSLT